MPLSITGAPRCRWAQGKVLEYSVDTAAASAVLGYNAMQPSKHTCILVLGTAAEDYCSPDNNNVNALMPDHTWRKAFQAEAMDEVDMRIQVLSHLNIKTLSSCCLAQWGE